ncbi:MAG: 30S ribosomal protein S20 [Pedobacter sp.]|nr:MAG: 30S ribosomal protein S20 [Pedobacter sp.]
MKKAKQIQSQKDVSQNQRNRLINRHYLTLIKKALKEYKSFLVALTPGDKGQLMNKQWKMMIKDTRHRQELSKLMVCKLFSLYDKAVKKRIFHKNTASRKKSNVQKLYNRVKWSI